MMSQESSKLIASVRHRRCSVFTRSYTSRISGVFFSFINCSVSSLQLLLQTHFALLSHEDLGLSRSSRLPCKYSRIQLLVSSLIILNVERFEHSCFHSEPSTRSKRIVLQYRRGYHKSASNSTTRPPHMYGGISKTPTCKAPL